MNKSCSRNQQQRARGVSATWRSAGRTRVASYARPSPPDTRHQQCALKAGDHDLPRAVTRSSKTQKGEKGWISRPWPPQGTGRLQPDPLCTHYIALYLVCRRQNNHSAANGNNTLRDLERKNNDHGEESRDWRGAAGSPRVRMARSMLCGRLMWCGNRPSALQMTGSWAGSAFGNATLLRAKKLVNFDSLKIQNARPRAHFTACALACGLEEEVTRHFQLVPQ